MNTTLTHFLLVSIGGAFGAVSRYSILWFTHNFMNHQITWAIAGINMLGSFIGGFVVALLLYKSAISSAWHPFIIGGFLGSFTTFSAFAIDIVHLLEQQAWQQSVISICINLFGSIIAVFIGMLVVRHWF